MVRCKCGKYSNFGLTCSSCRGSYFTKKSEEVEPDFEMVEKSEGERDDISFEEVEDFFQREDDDD
jgi:hypothetical protein